YSSHQSEGTPRTAGTVGNSADGASGPHSEDQAIGRRWTLENERCGPLQTRQDRYCGVEKRPIPKIAMGYRHHHGPLLPGQGERSNQPTRFPKLTIELFGL